MNYTDQFCLTGDIVVVDVNGDSYTLKSGTIIAVQPGTAKPR